MSLLSKVVANEFRIKYLSIKLDDLTCLCLSFRDWLVCMNINLLRNKKGQKDLSQTVYDPDLTFHNS